MGKIVKIIGACLFIVIIWQVVLFFGTVKEPLNEAITKSIQFLYENTDIKNIAYLDFYHGTESFQIFEGLGEDNEELIIWVPEKAEDFVVKQKKGGLTFEEVHKFAKEELDPEKLISIKLGIENSVPLYEIVYKDKTGRYSYYYVGFTDGRYLKHYHLG